ncbi:MarR family winged helix-turn-helix transcriptional regulator [Candidatus Stoquefichus sp. SB1]|uniref:MarR family winged helix-turn-helix transcriptional regulator n=1 Tax=Candidatus Stoquefichus sp. SB1 TaxID=1658109 RepID=UPI00067E8D13|nr:MarR family transcriptional regulator [Candidatus Stoquefichus sp. SB1]
MDRDELLVGMDNERILFGLFFAFGNRLQAAGDTFYDEITCKQFFLLICLSLFQDEAPTVNQLSEVMGSSHQNVKQLINKLEEKGFLQTVSDQVDKRKMRIIQTDKMAELKVKYEKQELAFMEQLYSGLTPQQIASTLQVIKIMENNLMKIKENGK